MKIRLLAAGSLLLTGLFLGGCFWASPGGIGLDEGRLEPCPDTPNCVSSQGEGEQAVEPLPFTGNLAETRSDVLSFLESEYGVTVQSESDTYVHATVTTTLGFVDDLQFRFVPTQRLVHVRSASRVGRSDLGVNRARIKALRQHLNP